MEDDGVAGRVFGRGGRRGLCAERLLPSDGLLHPLQLIDPGSRLELDEHRNDDPADSDLVPDIVVLRGARQWRHIHDIHTAGILALGAGV
jgi:hypothetical protein